MRGRHISLPSKYVVHRLSTGINFGACSVLPNRGAKHQEEKNLIATPVYSIRPFAFSFVLLNLWRACKNSIPSLDSNLERTIRTFIFLHPTFIGVYSGSIVHGEASPRARVRYASKRGFSSDGIYMLQIPKEIQ